MLSKTKWLYGPIILLICLVLFVLTCSKSGSGGVDEEPAPPRVENLSASEATPTTVRLTWSAPGDSGTQGNAVLYDVRYDTLLITEQNWNSATKATNVPGPPAPPGHTETMVVTGLIPNTLYCFALKAKNGSDKWSLLSTVDSITTLSDDLVNFPDTALNRVIRAKISKPIGDIHKSDLLPIGELVDSTSAIVNLSGLDGCLNLQKLVLIDKQITDITPLASLSHLDWLQMRHCNVSDISPLSGLTGMRRLYLDSNAINNLTPLTNFIHLEEIDLGSNNIIDISPLSGLSNLAFFFARENGISNISAVSGMSRLFSLSLSHNQISDLTPLAAVDSLVQMSLDFNNISDLTPLSNLIRLQFINLDWNQITSVTPLVNNTGLGSGDQVFLRFDPLPISWTTDSTTLANRGVAVYFVRQTH